MTPLNASTRTRAWRRKQTRRIVTKLALSADWLMRPLQKRKAERPAPLPGAKPHAPGKLTLAQERRQSWRLANDLGDEIRPEAAPSGPFVGPLMAA